MFLYNGEESSCIGDVVLPDGKRRIIPFSSDAHLKILAKAQQVLVDGTFRITPSLWTQTFIISAQVTTKVFVPVVIALLPDKKRESYDAICHVQLSERKPGCPGPGVECEISDVR